MRYIALGIALIVAVIALSTAIRFCGEAADVAGDEFGPKAALKKYEWFIDQANRIAKMDADIAVFENRAKAVDQNYAAYGEDRSKWPPHIQIQHNREKQMARDDLTAIVSQRNNLVRDYNAQSSKFNWEPFKTRSDMPATQIERYVIR